MNMLFSRNGQSNNFYIVKHGDTLTKIAKMFNITVEQLCILNNIKKQSIIYPKQKLIVNASITSNNQNQQNIKNKKNNINFFNDKALTKQDYDKIYFIARVLYSQTGTKTTEDQILKVASVIYNRTKAKAAFPNVTDVYTAVNNKSQFSCINDKKNSNWWQFKPALNERTKNAMTIAYQLYKGTFKPIDIEKDSDQKYYMYIDHSLSKVPAGFYSKKYWNLVRLPQTEHFKFYSLSPKKA